jgi:hypothetical protein
MCASFALRQNSMRYLKSCVVEIQQDSSYESSRYLAATTTVTLPVDITCQIRWYGLRESPFADIDPSWHLPAKKNIDNSIFALNESKNDFQLIRKSKRIGLTRNRTGVARMSYITSVMSIRTGSDNRYTIKPKLNAKLVCFDGNITKNAIYIPRNKISLNMRSKYRSSESYPLGIDRRCYVLARIWRSFRMSWIRLTQADWKAIETSLPKQVIVTLIDAVEECESAANHSRRCIGATTMQI